jgi:mono/diheme cytochrome c family protein
MTRRRLTIGITAFVVLTLIGTPLLAADAAALYKTKCFACHGEKGNGDTVMGKKLGVRNLGSAAVQAQNDAALTTIITSGKQKMPAYSGKIPDPDIKSLVAHIRTFAAK